MRLLVSFLCAAFFVTPAAAVTIAPLTFEQLVRNSAAVVVGRVVDVRGDFTGERRAIESAVTLAVVKGIKGAASETITFTVPGGRAGRYLNIIPGAPTFAPGDMDAALSRNPRLARALLRRSQEDLHETRQLMALTSRRSAVQRVAGQLYSLAEAASHSPCHPARALAMPISRSEMAQLLGLTVETVSRAITRLEQDGLIGRKGVRGIEPGEWVRLVPRPPVDGAPAMVEVRFAGQ